MQYCVSQRNTSTHTVSKQEVRYPIHFHTVRTGLEVCQDLVKPFIVTEDAVFLSGLTKAALIECADTDAGLSEEVEDVGVAVNVFA